MASNTISSASCGICSELCKEPHILTCLHSFCKKCLQKILEKEGSTLKCPTCGENSLVPNGTIDSLRKDHRKTYEAQVAEYKMLMKEDVSIPCDHCVKGRADVFCCDCCEFLCEKCADHHRSWRKTHDHELVSCGKEDCKENILEKISHKPLNCQIHSKESVDYYCTTCSALLCLRCVVGKHRDHAYEELDTVRGNEKTELLSYLEKAETARSKLKDSISHVEKVIQHVQVNHKEANRKIEEVFAQLQRRLKARKDVLLAESADIALSKETALSLQCEDLKKMESAISEMCTKLVSVTQDYTAIEMLSVKQPVSNRAKQLLGKYNKCMLAPCKLESIPASLTSSQLETDIDGFGAITGGCLPANSTIVMIKPTAAVGRKRELVLTAKGVEGKPHAHGGEPVMATLSLIGSDAASVTADVVDGGDGTYKLSVSPQSPGEHTLSITISNERIDGSPLAVYVRQPRDYSSLASSSRTFSLSSSAGDVAVGDNGHVYVAVTGYHCISVFDKNGSSIQTIGSSGSSSSANGRFSSPYGIAVKGDIMYVADQNNNRVQKLTTSGKFISKLGTGTQGSGKGQLNSPRGIALDKNGRVFVSESGNARVSVFSADGTFSHHIRGVTSSKSTISSPWGLAFDNDGNLHVANYSLNLIKVFTPEGMFITQYGKDIIQYPSGIAIDDEGYTFIGEYDACRLSVLNAQHQRVRIISSSFKYATGVCLDPDGFVYACDHSNSRVLKY